MFRNSTPSQSTLWNILEVSRSKVPLSLEEVSKNNPFKGSKQGLTLLTVSLVNTIFSFGFKSCYHQSHFIKIFSLTSSERNFEIPIHVTSFWRARCLRALDKHTEKSTQKHFCNDDIKMSSYIMKLFEIVFRCFFGILPMVNLRSHSVR